MILIEVLNEENQSQRNIARASGFSLGMTNLLLRRLIKKGYIKVTTLNRRTLRYILTPRGFAEKVSRSYDYLVASIKNLNEIKTRIKNQLPASVSDYLFFITGSNELAQLSREVLIESDMKFENTTMEDLEERLPKNNARCYILDCSLTPVDREAPVIKSHQVIRLREFIH